MSPMNNRLLVPQKLPLLLDYAPGAAAAYSLRALSNTYVGPVVTVRRSTDSAERDFTATEVSDGTLAAWCSGGDGFVKQWWSQTGSNHASQSTAGYQPQIVDSGVLVTEGGKAAVQFDGTDDYLIFASTITVSRYTNIAVYANDAIKTSAIIGLDDGQSIAMWSDQRTYENNGLSGQYVSTAYPFDEAMHIVSVTKSGDTLADFACHKDGVLLAAYTGNAFVSISLKYIGTRLSPAAYYDGTISELLIYPTDMTALRTRIEADMAFYY